MTPADPTNTTGPMRVLRHAVLSIACAVCLGMISTVVIAWAFAAACDTILHPTLLKYRVSPGAVWTVQPYSWYGARSEVWTPLDWASRSGQTSAQFDSAATSTYAGLPISDEPPRVIQPERLLVNGADPINLVEHYRGFPCLALGCATAIEPIAMGTVVSASSTRVSWGVEFKPAASAAWDVELVHLPLMPLFPGFYVDTGLFASLWWTLLFWRPLRRRRRIARGQCPACAYSLAGLPTGTHKCPECGTQVPTVFAA